MYFHYFIIISPWNKAWPFIWTKLNPLHPRMLWAKFGCNLSNGSGVEDELIWAFSTGGLKNRGWQILVTGSQTSSLPHAKPNDPCTCTWMHAHIDSCIPLFNFVKIEKNVINTPKTEETTKSETIIKLPIVNKICKKFIMIHV